MSNNKNTCKRCIHSRLQEMASATDRQVMLVLANSYMYTCTAQVCWRYVWFIVKSNKRSMPREMLNDKAAKSATMQHTRTHYRWVQFLT